MCIEFTMLKVKAHIIFLGTIGSSLLMEEYYYRLLPAFLLSCS